MCTQIVIRTTCMYIYYYKTLLLHSILLGKYKIDYITRKWDSSNETEQNNFPKLTTQNISKCNVGNSTCTCTCSCTYFSCTNMNTIQAPLHFSRLYVCINWMYIFHYLSHWGSIFLSLNWWSYSLFLRHWRLVWPLRVLHTVCIVYAYGGWFSVAFPSLIVLYAHDGASMLTHTTYTTYTHTHNINTYIDQVLYLSHYIVTSNICRP